MVTPSSGEADELVLQAETRTSRARQQAARIRRGIPSKISGCKVRNNRQRSCREG
jgi:hypothetical protein